MDMNFDHVDCTPLPGDWRLVGSPVRPDWHGLRARLYAAHAARRALVTLNGASANNVNGSFHKVAARFAVRHHQVLSSVNPDCWDDGKSGRVIHGPVAGNSRTGDRG
ncbi:MAG: hypothetical protein KDE55_08370 [Novosphingobium sp.]|nr:hypothetical protein [Novosphingobium sp.]